MYFFTCEYRSLFVTYTQRKQTKKMTYIRDRPSQSFPYSLLLPPASIMIKGLPNSEILYRIKLAVSVDFGQDGKPDRARYVHFSPVDLGEKQRPEAYLELANMDNWDPEEQNVECKRFRKMVRDFHRSRGGGLCMVCTDREWTFLMTECDVPAIVVDEFEIHEAIIEMDLKNGDFRPGDDCRVEIPEVRKNSIHLNKNPAFARAYVSASLLEDYLINRIPPESRANQQCEGEFFAKSPKKIKKLTLEVGMEGDNICMTFSKKPRTTEQQELERNELNTTFSKKPRTTEQQEPK